MPARVENVLRFEATLFEQRASWKQAPSLLSLEETYNPTARHDHNHDTVLTSVKL